MRDHRNRARTAGVLCALAALCSAFAAGAEEATYLERNLTHEPDYAAGEPHIAVNPTNPNNIVYVSTFYKYVEGWAPTLDEYGNPDYEGSFVTDISQAVTLLGNSAFGLTNCFVAVSEDRGKTWTPGRFPTGNRPHCGDPMVHVDANGIFYIGIDWMGNNTVDDIPTRSSDPIGVVHSTDGGHNWSDMVATGTNVDRPWMRVDVATGKVYVESGFGSRNLAVSSDRGLSWSTRVPYNNGSHLAVYDGIMATSGGGMFHYSTDDGQSYTSLPVPGLTDNGDGFGFGGGWTSADPTKKGRFAIMARSGDDYQLWVTSDTGQSWTQSPPISAPGGTLPWMDFGWSGVLGVMWKSNDDGNVYSVISTDQGVSFSSPVRVNGVSAAWDNCHGDDLSWITSDKDYTYIGWADNRNDNGHGGQQCDGFFARVPLGCYAGTAPAANCPSF